MRRRWTFSLSLSNGILLCLNSHYLHEYFISHWIYLLIHSRVFWFQKYLGNCVCELCCNFSSLSRLLRAFQWFFHSSAAQWQEQHDKPNFEWMSVRVNGKFKTQCEWTTLESDQSSDSNLRALSWSFKCEPSFCFWAKFECKNYHGFMVIWWASISIKHPQTERTVYKVLETKN